MTVLRDVRDSQTEPSPALLSWRSSHSDDWPLQLSASLAANSWSATSFLRLSTSTARSPCRASFVAIVAVKVAMSSFFAAMSPAWLALRSSSSFWAAINCFSIPMISPLCGAYPRLAPHDKKENDVERSPSETLFMVLSSQTATSTEVETWFLLSFTRACFQILTTLTFRALHGNHNVMISPAVYPRLFSHHFDMQSTVREITMSWTVLPFTRACFDHFDFQNIARESHCVSTI